MNVPGQMPPGPLREIIVGPKDGGFRGFPGDKYREIKLLKKKPMAEGKSEEISRLTLRRKQIPGENDTAFYSKINRTGRGK
jgi:hypothetical protein